VVFAGIVAATSKDAPLAVMAQYPWASVVSVLVFAGAVLGLYAWTRNQAATAPLLPEDHVTPPREITPR
jgi:hypothetical protein